MTIFEVLLMLGLVFLTAVNAVIGNWVPAGVGAVFVVVGLVRYWWAV